MSLLNPPYLGIDLGDECGNVHIMMLDGIPSRLRNGGSVLRRKWVVFGNLVSKEGYEIYFAHKSAYFEDEKGKFEFAYEDGVLVASRVFQVSGRPIELTDAEIHSMAERVAEAIRYNGWPLYEIYR